MALTDKLSNIANAIRTKTGGTDSLTLDQMPDAINSISGTNGLATMFNWTDSGTGITLGEAEMKGVTRIPSWAFTSLFNEDWDLDRVHIARLDIPSTVQTIYPYAFWSARNTVPVHVDFVNICSLQSWCNVNIFDVATDILFDTAGGILWEGTQTSSITMPFSHVNAYCFRKARLTSVNFDSTVNYIGNYAFWKNYLTSVTLTNTELKSIGDYAFTDNQITSLTLHDEIDTIGDGAFAGNDISYEFTLPSQLTLLGASAFAQNTRLTSVRFQLHPSGSIPTIGDSPFDGCTSLTDIYVPWAEGEADVTWGCNATIHYNS